MTKPKELVKQALLEGSPSGENHSAVNIIFTLFFTLQYIYTFYMLKYLLGTRNTPVFIEL